MATTATKPVLIFFSILEIFSRGIHSSPMGAPPSACESMTPGHGAEPQTGELPYTIILEKLTLNPGESMKVTPSSKDGQISFKGFLVMARKPGGGSTPYGVFKEAPEGVEDFKTIDCSSKIGSAATHTNRTEKMAVELMWTAPEEDGEYVIAATFVKEKMIYWVETLSEKFTVGNPGSGTETTTPASGGSIGEPSEEALKVYDGCGSTKGCFGFPGNCVPKRDCNVVASYQVLEGRVNMEMTGKADTTQPTPFIAVGFSDDDKMGSDHVIGCRVDGSTVSVTEYQNVPGEKYNDKVDRSSPILTMPAGSFVNGHIACSFSLPTAYEVKELSATYDLNRDEPTYHLLLAHGPNSAPSYLGKHPDAGKEASGAKVNFLKAEILGSSSKLLIKLHGSIMIFAWLLFATTGKFIARHFKHNHVDLKICGSDFWFMAHRIIMGLTALMSVSSGVLIFIEIGGYSTGTDFASKVHPALGVLVNTLAVLQIVGGLLRPHPGDKNRTIFNWAHYISGNTAFVVGVICIYLAMDLSKTNLQSSTKYWVTLTAFISFHIVIHAAITLHGSLVDPDNEGSFLRKMIGPMPRLKIEGELPGTFLRTMLLVTYIIVAAITASLLTYFVNEALD